MNRRHKIEAMLQDDPSDQFLRYSLAMELRSEGDNTRSLALLNGLMNDETPSVPAFFMAAQQLIDLDQTDLAREHLRNGIAEANRQGDTHAGAEMNDLLMTLGESDEL